MQLRKDLMRLASNKVLASRLKWKRFRTPLLINIIMWVISVILVTLVEGDTYSLLMETGTDCSLLFALGMGVGSFALVFSFILFVSAFNKYNIYQINVIDKEIGEDEGTPIYCLLTSNNKHIIVESAEVYNQIDAPSMIVAWCYACKVYDLYRGV